jgi:hypothetical protein
MADSCQLLDLFSKSTGWVFAIFVFLSIARLAIANRKNTQLLERRDYVLPLSFFSFKKFGFAAAFCWLTFFTLVAKILVQATC